MGRVGFVHYVTRTIVGTSKLLLWPVWLAGFEFLTRLDRTGPDRWVDFSDLTGEKSAKSLSNPLKSMILTHKFTKKSLNL